MTDAWSLVDSVHRLRELLSQLPGMKQQQPELQLFLRSTQVITDLRNFVQHFRTEIHSFAKSKAPLWGTLSWVFGDEGTAPLTNHIVIPGTYFKEVSAIGCVYDTWEQRYVEKIIFRVGENRLELADLSQAVERLAKWYVEWFEAKYQCTERFGADVHCRFQLQFVPKEEKP